MPFVKNEVQRYSRARSSDDKDDELSIAMFAFYEALVNYDRSKGAFFHMADVYIRNRLIDFNRRERRNDGLLSLDEKLRGDGDATLLDTIEDERASRDWEESRECTAEEIAHFKDVLSGYGLTLDDIADNCPRQKRTMDVCLDALDYAKSHPELLDILAETGKLPLSKLVREGGFDRKTLERHRKYLVGIFLAYTNGFVIIRSHLRLMKGERNG